MRKKEYIDTVKFPNRLKESPCSPVVTFPSFGSEGHGVQPPQGNSFFPYLFLTSLMFFRRFFVTMLFLYLGSTNFSLYLIGEDLQKNGS